MPYIADPDLTPRSFYRDVLGQLGIPAPFHSREAKRLFGATLLEGYRSHGGQPVIVLDEAHLLAPDMLQEIRFILNFHFDSVSPISFVAALPDITESVTVTGTPMNRDLLENVGLLTPEGAAAEAIAAAEAML